jgi:hypothetical protein
MLPESLISPLQEHLSNVKRLHAQDVMQGVAPVYLPFALERKYPHAGRLLRRERYAQPLDPTSTSTYGSGDGLARFAERVNCTPVAISLPHGRSIPNSTHSCRSEPRGPCRCLILWTSALAMMVPGVCHEECHRPRRAVWS